MGAQFAFGKGWHAAIARVEGLPPFGIERQRHHDAIHIRPLSARRAPLAHPRRV